MSGREPAPPTGSPFGGPEAEEQDVVWTAIHQCGRDSVSDPAAVPRNAVYHWLENTPRTTLVARLVDKLHSLGYRIVKADNADQARLQPSPEAGCSAFVVHDMTGSVPDKECKTREIAEAWVRHLTEARPNARPVILPNAEVSHGDRECKPDTHSTHKQP